MLVAETIACLGSWLSSEIVRPGTHGSGSIQLISARAGVHCGSEHETRVETGLGIQTSRLPYTAYAPSRGREFRISLPLTRQRVRVGAVRAKYSGNSENVCPFAPVRSFLSARLCRLDCRVQRYDGFEPAGRNPRDRDSENLCPTPLPFLGGRTDSSAPGTGGSTRRIRPRSTEPGDSHSPLVGQERKS